MKIYKKYTFNTQEEIDNLIDQLGYTEKGGVKYPAHRHTIVKLGLLTLEPGVYDEDENLITPPVISNKYAVDILWKGLPTDEEGNTIYPSGWEENVLTGRDSYLHGFYGLTYNE